MKLDNFFKPKTIAIVGASDHIEKVGGILLDKALRSKAKIIPVNPSHDSLFGVKCYKSIMDYKGSIDLAVIAIPKDYVSRAVEECGKKGIKEVIIISAGFSEVGEEDSEKEVKNIAQKYGIRFMGPNCFGVFNPLLNLDLTFSRTSPERGKVAFISQSGALWSYMADFSVGKFGFSGFASLGNMADLEFSDFIEYFSRDKETEAIVLYIEKLKNGRRFIELCKKSKKPIFAVKAGSSEEGSKAAFSHTGSLATDYKIYQGAFKQSGVKLCNSLIEAFEAALGKKLIEKNSKKYDLGKRVFVITNAGGAGALLADYLSSKNIKLITKPLDILGTALAQDYKKALEDNESLNMDTIYVIVSSQSMTELKETAKVIADFKNNSKKNVIALFLGGKSMQESNRIFSENNIPYFNILEDILLQ